MKKTLILTIVIALLLTAAGCTSTPTNPESTTSGQNTTNTTTTASTTTAATVDAELGKPIIIGDYQVTIQEVVISEDYEGKDAITVVYDWTNNSTETVAPIWSVNFKVFQDGKELETAILMDDNTADSLSEVRPAITVEGLGEHFITTSQNELEIEISELISFDDPILLKVPFPTN